MKHILILISVSLFTSSCVGPTAIRTERLDYSDAIATTSRQQLLLNLVRVHNQEQPQFVDVSQIINSSQINGSLGATFNLPQTLGKVAGGNTYTGHDYSPVFSIGGNDSPAITYVPLLGSALVNQVAQPFTVDTIAALIDSEWQVQPLLCLVADRVSPAASQAPQLLVILQDLWEHRLISFAPAKSVATSGTLDDSLDIFFLHDQLLSLPKNEQGNFDAEWRVLAAAYQRTYIPPDALGIYPPARNLSFIGEDPRQFMIEVRTAPATQPALLTGDQVAPAMRLRSGLGMLIAADHAGYVQFLPESDFASVWHGYTNVHDSYVLQRPDKAASTSRPDLIKAQIVTESISSRLTTYSYKGTTIHLVGIAHGANPPTTAYVSVKYKGEYYYIASWDTVSQTNFELMSTLLTMQAVATTTAPPAPTIAIGGH